MPKAKRVGSWGDIDPKVFKKFAEAVEKLREEMVPRDCDGSSPISYLIVNRITHEPLHYFPVPRNQVYSYEERRHLEFHPDRQQELDDETERMLASNAHMAAEALNSYIRIKYHRNVQGRESRRPYRERIINACGLCKTKEGFDLNNPDDHFAGLRQKYPGYPAFFHKSGEACKAFGIRRSQFQAEHPEVFGVEPEPRYCSNQGCRARLRDEETRKGAGDRDICPNPACGRKNNPPAARVGASK